MRGGTSMLLLMVSLFVWSFTYACHWLIDEPQTALFFLDLTYIGVVAVPILFFIFVLEFTNLERWMNRTLFALLLIEPVVTLILLITDPYHNLFYGGYREPGMTSIYKGGPWLWINIAYSFVLIAIGFLRISQFFIQSSRAYRRQAWLLLIGALFPISGVVVGILDIGLSGLDLTPILFTITGLIYANALLSTGLLDLLPIARSTLFDALSDGVIVLDLQNRVIDANPAAIETLRNASNKIIGRSIREILAHHPEIIEMFRDRFEARGEVMLTGDANRYFDIQILPLKKASGVITGRVITWHDITTLKEAEFEQEQLIAELDAYAHTVAHELKGPISLTISFVDLIEESDPEFDEETGMCIDHIQQASYKMLNIIDELLLFSSIKNEEDIPIEVVEMGPVVRRAFERTKYYLKSELTAIQQPDSWPDTVGYIPWVEQVWVNYISNALKYGGDPGKLELGYSEQPDGQIMFWIKDEGPGLTKKEQEGLFKKFKRVERYSEVKGHGLGLSVVRRIVERLGGQVGVESEPGKGSTFYFTLPAV